MSRFLDEVGLAHLWGKVVGAVAGTELFSGTYSATHASAVALGASVEGYSRLLVEFEDAAGRRGSATVDRPEGGTLVGAIVGCTTTGANSAAGMVIRSKTYRVGTTSIAVDRDGHGRDNCGMVTIDPTGAASWEADPGIGIVRVVGWA